MYKLGLKLFSTNTAHIDEAFRLLEDDLFQYVELYALPGSFNETKNKWLKLKKFPFIIHAPHHKHGVNLADAAVKDLNTKNIKDSQTFADLFHSQYIIVHGGNNGSLENTISVIEELKDNRFILENIPLEGVGGERCVGATPEEMHRINQNAFFSGFVLDVGHAILASMEISKSPYDLLLQMVELKPKMYHIMDGLRLNKRDLHLALGEGDYNLPWVLQQIPKNSMITIETPLNLEMGLLDHKKNAQFFRNLEMGITCLSR